ncbi:MAG: hypothetical protein KIT72_09890 [Polyangiaceae bacterium]|nr:hypothetical protein [Polyangiaceae bacterium]
MVLLVRWSLGVICCAGFLWIGSLNWAVFWLGHVRRVKAPSWTPLLAGLLGTAAVLLVPLDLARFWWMPLVLDWGSVPGIAHAIIWHLFVKRDN